MSRASSREIQAGVAVLIGLLGLGGLLFLAGGGPGFLTSRQIVEVNFRDAQGIRAGSPVRVAGLDAGRVSSVDLAEDSEGNLRARLRLSLTADLAKRLRHDVKITINAGLTGQGTVNIVSSGSSAVALMPGQVVQGVETSFFDPILEQVGLGPVERNHLSKTIAEVRKTVGDAGPRLQLILGSLQATANEFRETAEMVRPAVVSTAKRVDESMPKIEAALKRLDTLLARADAVVADNRPTLKETIANLRDLTATANDIAAQDRKKIEVLLDGLDGTRKRADRVLYQVDQMAGQGNSILTKNRADLERTMANVRDATGWADKLVQKIYGNPFYLSPLYKPKPEDVRTQGIHDMAQSFMMGAKELNDAVKNLKVMQGKPMTPQERQAFDALLQRAANVEARLDDTSQRLTENLRTESPRANRMK